MPYKYIAPRTAESFNCPHCGALAHQKWFKAYGRAYEMDEFPWWEPRDNIEGVINANRELSKEDKQDRIEFFKKLKSRQPFFDRTDESHAGRLMNVDFSLCYSCKGICVWVGCKVVYPDFIHEVEANEDLPEDIKVDFREAQRISKMSPRGSAALLRLCIQKLCKHLGEKGRNINDDIASLVQKGLDIKIQKALDVVRVIGNEAVHPGQIDLRDDVETANQLFTLVNVIADSLITQPRVIDRLFAEIPQSKRVEIAKRDS